MTLLEWSSINILMSKKMAKKFSEAKSNADFRRAGEELISFIAGFHLEIQALNDDSTDLIIYNRTDRTGIYLKVEDREFTSTVIFLTDELRKLIKERFAKDLEEDQKMLEDIMEQLDQGIISYDDMVDAVEIFEEFHGLAEVDDYENMHYCEIHGQYEAIEGFYEDIDNAETDFFDEDFLENEEDYDEDDEGDEDDFLEDSEDDFLEDEEDDFLEDGFGNSEFIDEEDADYNDYFDDDFEDDDAADEYYEEDFEDEDYEGLEDFDDGDDNIDPDGDFFY